MAEDVTIITADATYTVPANELEKYRDKDGKGYAEAGIPDIDPNLLRPGSTIRLNVGKKPVIRTKGAIVFSSETACSSRAE